MNWKQNVLHWNPGLKEQEKLRLQAEIEKQQYKLDLEQGKAEERLR